MIHAALLLLVVVALGALMRCAVPPPPRVYHYYRWRVSWPTFDTDKYSGWRQRTRDRRARLAAQATRTVDVSDGGATPIRPDPSWADARADILGLAFFLHHSK